MGTRYKIVTEGKLREGVGTEQFIHAFAQTFKVAEEQARKILATGRTITLKDNLDRDTAEKFKRVLIEQIGLEVRVEEKEALSLSVVSDANAGAETAGTATPDATSRCPKCGSDRISGDECQACGIIISRYLARQRQAHAGSASGETWNPYQSTSTQDIVDDDEFGLRTVDAGDGWQWIVGGWRLFVKNPWAWIASLLIWYIITFAAGLIPIIGSFAINILSPVFVAGLMLGAREQASGGNLTVGHLFQGFSTEFGKLVQAGLLYLVASIVVIIIAVIIFAISGLGAFMHHAGNLNTISEPSIITIFILIVFALIALALLAMAFYYVPLLIVFDGHGPISAMTHSFSACWKNAIPFLIYGLTGIGLAVLAMIPFGLGFFVLAPVMVASMYVSYRQIFHGES